MNEVILSIRNVTKTYPGVIALNNYSMDFEKGEVHALLGENGAGKSTLIKIISGAIEPDSGQIIFGDRVFKKMTPHLARNLGVEVIYQEFSLVESLTVAQNVYLGAGEGIGVSDGTSALHILLRALDIGPGDEVITSGLGGNFPKNLIIGQVTEVIKQDFDMYQRAVVRPTVDFNRLEFVLVITNFQPGELESVG